MLHARLLCEVTVVAGGARRDAVWGQWPGPAFLMHWPSRESYRIEQAK